MPGAMCYIMYICCCSWPAVCLEQCVNYVHVLLWLACSMPGATCYIMYICCCSWPAVCLEQYITLCTYVVVVGLQ